MTCLNTENKEGHLSLGHLPEWINDLTFTFTIIVSANINLGHRAISISYVVKQ